jgi:hypothetical protein
MFNWRNHPDELALLRFCEGEIKTRELARIERHVRSCWECRAQIDDVRRTVSDYVRYRQDVLLPAMSPPSAPWANLDREMQRLRSQEASPRFPAFRLPLPWAFAGLAAIAASAVALYLWQPAPRPVPIAPAVPQPVRTEPIAPRAPAALSPKAPAPGVEPASPDDELNVIVALHGMGADLGDPVTVFRQRDRILVSLAGLDPARAAEIYASLAGLPNISIDDSPPAPAHPSSAITEPGQSSPPLSPIARQFSDRAAYQKFVDRTLESSDAMMARIHALRSLADRFPPGIEAQLTPAGIRRLAAIRHEHTAALVGDIRSMDASLAPVLTSSSATEPLPAPPASTWQNATRHLFSIAQRTDRLIATLLGVTTNDSAAASTPADTAAALAQLKSAAASYQRQ